MRYSRFELLVFILGLGIVVLSTIALIRAHQDFPEIVGQVLILLVLLGAIHYGRNGGIITFLISSTIYFLFRVPVILQSGLESSGGYIVLRLSIFALVGILGGEICSRIKYVFLNLEHHDYIDPTTMLYSFNFFSTIVRRSIADYDRSQKPFSIMTIELVEAAWGDEPSLKEMRLKDAGKAIRNNLRVLDEVGRTYDRAFSVLLVGTPRENAELVQSRMQSVLERLLKRHIQSMPVSSLIKIDIMTYPENADLILAEFPPPNPVVETAVPTTLTQAAPETPLDDENVDHRTE